MYLKYINRFYTIVFVTVITIYLVIIAGSIVRSTGSGMGCPDWPKCFETYIPPTDVSQLPVDYKTRYSVKGHPAEFNVYKTWTEYGNRLIGAISGLVVIFQCIYSSRFLKSKPKFFWFSFLLVILMGFQGVLGAKVVYSLLAPLLITLHMLFALVILGILIWLLTAVKIEINRHASSSMNETLEMLPKLYSQIMWVFIVLTAIQIFLGTEVREEIDILSFALNYQEKNTWIERIGTIFLIHRSYSILLTLATGFFTFKIYQKRHLHPIAYNYAKAICLVIVLEIIAGVILAYCALPAWVQPIHLLLATILLGLQMGFVFRFMVGQNRRSV
jgi:cytochrome c oxidase assembly protein subunit 15